MRAILARARASAQGRWSAGRAARRRRMEFDEHLAPQIRLVERQEPLQATSPCQEAPPSRAKPERGASAARVLAHAELGPPEQGPPDGQQLATASGHAEL